MTARQANVTTISASTHFGFEVEEGDGTLLRRRDCRGLNDAAARTGNKRGEIMEGTVVAHFKLAIVSLRNWLSGSRRPMKTHKIETQMIGMRPKSQKTGT